MCGIFGAVGEDLRHDDLLALGSRLTHRGPDDRGLEVWKSDGVALGHTRLAIVDLTAAGRNPLSNEDGTVWVTFNGEIYNQADLRRELERHGHVFRSNADTEVLVHAYEQWGDDHIHRLRGMFAYALYDRRPSAGRRGRVLLVRDRVGIKPLYYAAGRHGFLFASEFDPLRRTPGVDTRRDWSAIADYLTYRYVPAPKTPVTGIRKLLPGHWLELAPGSTPTVRQYWTLPTAVRHELRSPASAREALDAALRAAVARHLMSDVRIGVLLSGGVDSSGVAALAVEAGLTDLASFTMAFDVPGKQDAAAARLVARRLATDHHEDVATAERIDVTLEQVASMFGEPFADGSAIPTRALCRLARRHVKVALSGDGGDELFGGYGHYRRWLRHRIWFDGVPVALRRTVADAIHPVPRPGERRSRLIEVGRRGGAAAYGSFLELFSPAEKRALAGPELASLLRDYDDHWLFARHWRTDLDPLTRVQYVDLHTFLADDILTKVDRASMSCGLEVRPVLLDHELVELAFSMPARVRSGWAGLRGKRLLRQVLQGRVPPAILARPKSGFGAPLDAWLSAETDAIVTRLAAGPLAAHGVIDPDGLRRIAPCLRGLRLWSLLVLERALTAAGRPAAPLWETIGPHAAL